MTLDYRNPMHQPTQRSKGWGKAIGWSLGGVVALGLLVTFLTPSLGRARETANRVKCASCLKETLPTRFRLGAAHAANG